MHQNDGPDSVIANRPNRHERGLYLAKSKNLISERKRVGGLTREEKCPARPPRDMEMSLIPFNETLLAHLCGNDEPQWERQRGGGGREGAGEIEVEMEPRLWTGGLMKGEASSGSLEPHCLYTSLFVSKDRQTAQGTEQFVCLSYQNRMSHHQLCWTGTWNRQHVFVWVCVSMEGRATIQTERRRILENEVSHFFVITTRI